MINLIRSEYRKLVSTRSFYWLTAGVIALSVIAVVSASGQGEGEWVRDLSEQQFVFLGTFTKLLLIVLGIRAVTDEYRFGTVLPTFVTQPVRWKVIAAKTVVMAGTGALVALLGQLVMMGSALVVFSMNGYGLEIGGEMARLVLGGTLAGMLWALLGVGIGALVRSQVAAIVGSFVWLMGLEEMIRSRLGDLARFLPGQAGTALAIAERALVVGAVAMLAWALAFLALGTLTTERADIA